MLFFFHLRQFWNEIPFRRTRWNANWHEKLALYEFLSGNVKKAFEVSSQECFWPGYLARKNKQWIVFERPVALLLPIAQSGTNVLHDAKHRNQSRHAPKVVPSAQVSSSIPHSALSRFVVRIFQFFQPCLDQRHSTLWILITYPNDNAKNASHFLW